MDQDTNEDQKSPEEEVTFDSWFEQLDEQAQALINARLQQDAQEASSARKNLEKELRAAAKKLEAGSEAERALTANADKLAVAERRIRFLEQASNTIDDVKLAWLAVQGGDYEKKDGSFDFEKLKATHPKLFKEAITPKGNVGSGTSSDVSDRKFSMNGWLKAAIRR